MAEEIKNQDKAQNEVKEGKEETKSSANLQVLGKYIAGVGILILGVVMIALWWRDLLTLIRGGVGPLLLLIGVIIIAIAKD